MSDSSDLFQINSDLQIGTIFEVSSDAVKIALDRNIMELNRTYRGRVYSVGQIGSIIKFHLGRKILFAHVSLLRLQSDEEAAAISATTGSVALSFDRRVLEANMLGEGWWNAATNSLRFLRGASTYPLPLQPVHLITKEETEHLFKGAEESQNQSGSKYVTIGEYTGATKVPCRVDVDKLCGQHSAVLGSTGSGKSGTVASIIHSILDQVGNDKTPAKPRIIIIDPHGEYEAAFIDQAVVYQAYDALVKEGDAATKLTLPYWLLSGDEFRSLIIGKTEFEATSQANTIYKALTHARMFEAGLVPSALLPVPAGLGLSEHPQEPRACPDDKDATKIERETLIASFDRDKPTAFKLVEFEAHIRNRQAKKWVKTEWVDNTPAEFQKEYASILDKLRVLRNDPRISFLLTEYVDGNPDLVSIVSQFIGIENKDDPSLKIVDISGLPNEVAGPLAGAIARLLFQYKLYQTRKEREKDPVLLICEEAHRYVPNRGEAQYAVAQDAIRRIAREGRKYGLGLMLVSQRPADVEGTVISQCNSWIVLRLSNSADQEHVARFLPDTLSGMTKALSSLPRQEALFVGEAAVLPARIRITSLPKDKLPASGDISFSSGWRKTPPTKDEIGAVVKRMQEQ